MSRLFESTEINGLKLSNRFVRSATWEGMAGDDGSVTPALVDLMARLAEGGVGLIISSHAYIKPEGQAGAQTIRGVSGGPGPRAPEADRGRS